jgi:hypothetical protein
VQNYNFGRLFVWMWNLTYRPRGEHELQQYLDIPEEGREGDQIKDNGMCGTRMKLRSGYIIWIGNPEGRRSLGTHRYMHCNCPLCGHAFWAPLVRVIFAWEYGVDVTPPLPSPTSLSAVVAALLPMIMGRECRRNLPWAQAVSSRMTADFCWCLREGIVKGY